MTFLAITRQNNPKPNTPKGSAMKTPARFNDLAANDRGPAASSAFGLGVAWLATELDGGEGIDIILGIASSDTVTDDTYTNRRP